MKSEQLNMANKTIVRNPYKKVINVLSHPAWNGVTCFFTVLAALGLGGFVLTSVLWLFYRTQALMTWLSEPLSIPSYLIVCGLMVMLALIASIVHQYFSSHRRLPFPIKWSSHIENKPKFVTLSLPSGIGNSFFDTRFIDPPLGDVLLGGVEFQLQLKSLIFDTNEQIRYFLQRDDGSKEVEFQLIAPINQIKCVYFLINSGNSKRIYENEMVGKIILMFKNAPPIVKNLVLGQNIREWCPGNPGDLVRETSSPELIMGVWIGLSKQGTNAVIDCLKVQIYECMRGNFLEKIIFVHKPTQRPSDMLGVHYSVFAVSLEIEQDV